MLSTCNRVEVYSATEDEVLPTHEQVSGFLARFHGIEPAEVTPHLYHSAGEAAVKHLFTVACSLDSMVVGEPQILAQVKQAYQTATQLDATGPLLHSAFQAALMVARRVAAETAIHQRRVSIPSVAVADFAQQIFERFDNKHTVVIGAGEMAEETLRYLRDEGAQHITVVNRRVERADELAVQWQGRAVGWEQLTEALATADLVISTTGASEPIVTLEHFARIERCAAAAAAVHPRPGRAAGFRAGHRRRGPTSISTRSTTCKRPASATAATATANCRPRCGSSNRRPAVSSPTGITAPPGR